MTTMFDDLSKYYPDNDVMLTSTDSDVLATYLSFRQSVMQTDDDSRRQYMMKCLKFAHLIQDDNFLDHLVMTMTNAWSIYQPLLDALHDNLRDDIYYHLPYYLLPTTVFDKFVFSREKFLRWSGNVVGKTFTGYSNNSNNNNSSNDSSNNSNNTSRIAQQQKPYIHKFICDNIVFYTSYDDKMYGVFIRWHDKGNAQLADIIQMHDGVKHGWSKSWFGSGNLAYIERYYQGRPTGRSVYYCDEARVQDRSSVCADDYDFA